MDLVDSADRVDSARILAAITLRAASSRRSDGTPESDLVAAESSSETWLQMPIAITIAKLLDRGEKNLCKNSSFGRRIDSRMTISIPREGLRNLRFRSGRPERMKILRAAALENVLPRVGPFIRTAALLASRA